MDSNIFLLLSALIVLATAMSALMRFLKQPLIMGYILTGVLVGPSFLHLIPRTTPFAAFSNIGIALLLFIIGLGLNATIIKRLGRVVLITSLIQIILTAMIAFLVASYLGFDTKSAVIIGVTLTFSSTIIIIKILNDKREQTRLYGQISIGILLLQDIIASVVLVLLSAANRGSLNPKDLLVLGVKGLVAGGFIILISNQLLPRIHRFISGSQEFLFLFALAWGLGIATLFEILGFSIAVGALFAGISLASLPYSQEIAARLKPLRDFFIVVFFVSLGLGVKVSAISDAIVPALVLSLVVVIAKPLIVLTTMGALGYVKRTSFKTALTMGQISEFSLILVVLASNFTSENVGTIITLVALITIAISTYLMNYDEQLFLFLEHALTFFERTVVKSEQKHAHYHYPLVLFGYHKGGEEFVKAFKSLNKKFVVIDYNPDVIEQLEHRHINYLYGDASDLELLEELCLEKTKLLVSTIPDFDVNSSLLHHALKINPQAIIICHADNYEEAAQLYELGAMYVMMPHLIGSERIGSFIRKSGLNKEDFVHYRDKHLATLQKNDHI